MTNELDATKGLVNTFSLGFPAMPTSFADRVRFILHENGWTQRELARRAGLRSETHINAMIRKRSPVEPTLSTAIAIARAAGVTVQWLATGEGPQYPDDAALRDAMRRAARRILKE